MEKTNVGLDLSQLSAEQKSELLSQLQKEQNDGRLEKRNAYESLRAEFLGEVRKQVVMVAADVVNFKKWLEREAQSFIELMKEYGEVKKEGQMSFIINDGAFKLEVACNKVKGFDERADLAAERLMDYLKGYMQRSEKGSDDPMYQLAMTLLERNKAGELDYKSISKLYSLEERFDEEYGEIMALFKEANVVQQNATNFYFHVKDPETGVWRRIEPSFCRI